MKQAPNQQLLKIRKINPYQKKTKNNKMNK